MTAKSVSLVALVLLVAGCNTLPVQNKPLTSYAPDYGYRYRNVAPGPNDSDSLLVVLTFSGGGTRAAALSYGVLCVLRDTPIYWEGRTRRLLDEVDVISSASGGSLTAAYYALFGDRIFEDYAAGVLHRNIQGSLIRRLLSPGSLVKLLSPFYGRTDLMADDFSRRFFERKTYGDLLDWNTRPFIIINTTDMLRGSQIGFTQGSFDLFYSDLSSYPIGNAVAASAAFPGLLAPMTLRNYPKPEDFRPPEWATADRSGQVCFVPDDPSCYLDDSRPYIHVIDGGVADNLGLLPVIVGLDGRYSDDRIGAHPPHDFPKKVIIITVNAAGITKRGWDLSAGLPGLVDTLLAAGTAPLGNFSNAQIAYVRQQIAYRDSLQEIRRALAEQGVEADVPILDRPDIDFRFIEVAFSQLADPDEREQLLHIPTNFHLPDSDVDRVCASAQAILATNPDFKALVAALAPPE
ncbi:MAG TPA: patatin-like phospholipase family protein [Candidatus Hydrogenedentes bacterium]|nr:patatin-like phospholipase family protein [Candidatus Hydrogenedentota bacterium]HPG70117.1 patatin-like phospholipase family protein [Candidatus Hydrogenedentota bacterium]